MSKGSDENAKSTDALKENKSVTYWICVKDHFAKNCLLKRN